MMDYHFVCSESFFSHIAPDVMSAGCKRCHPRCLTSSPVCLMRFIYFVLPFSSLASPQRLLLLYEPLAISQFSDTQSCSTRSFLHFKQPIQ